MGLFESVLNHFGYAKLDKQSVNAGTIEKEFGVLPVASRVMDDNINLWYALYTNNAPWKTHEVKPLGLPAAIGRELSRHALTEFSMTVSGSARADYINEQIEAMNDKLSQYLELGLCLGGVALKPYPMRDKIIVDAFTTGFTPTHFDEAGKAIGGVFKSEPVRVGKEWFVKLEYHDFRERDDGSAVYVVENKAFKSSQDGAIGAQVSLSDIPEWADLSEHEEIEGLDAPLFAYFKPPVANNIDMSSPLGVSVYAGATVDLLKEADEQWERFLWTYKAGEPKIIADGLINETQANDRLFLRSGFTSGGNLFTIFDPTIKDDAYYQGLQRIIQRIEFDVGLSFGTISDPQVVEKTATEIMTAKNRQFVTEKNIQKAFEPALDDVVYAMNAWCSLLNLAPQGDYDVEHQWGDGVLDDPDTRRQDMAMDRQLVSDGLMNDWEFRVRWFKEDEETARKMLPGVEQMTRGETQNELE